MNGYAEFSQPLLNLALVLPRLAAAFLILPLLSRDSMPAMVRNVFLVSLAVVVYPLIGQMQVPPVGVALAPLVAKEIFVGVSIGYSFSIIFWALEGAGQVIDNKVGATTAQLVDPLSGHQTSLTGAFMTHFAAWLFVAFGGLTVFLELVLNSYLLWPVHTLVPELSALGQAFFVQRFADLMGLILLLAAPFLVLLTLVEAGFGLINRFAPQLNVFALSMPVKGWLATAILMLMLGTIVEHFLAWVGTERGLLDVLRGVL